MVYARDCKSRYGGSIPSYPSIIGGTMFEDTKSSVLITAREFKQKLKQKIIFIEEQIKTAKARVDYELDQFIGKRIPGSFWLAKYKDRDEVLRDKFSSFWYFGITTTWRHLDSDIQYYYRTLSEYEKIEDDRTVTIPIWLWTEIS